MNVVAFVGQTCLTRLQSARAGTDTLHHLASLADVQHELDVGDADVAVIDLEVCPGAQLTALAHLVAEHGSAVIAYGAFAPPVVRTMARLARHGLRHMVFRGLDDTPSSFRSAIREAAATRISAEIVERLSPMLSRAPTAVRESITQLFSEPLRFRCAADIADVAGITRRSLDRTLCALEMEPARTFLLAARLTWAYLRIRNASTTVCEVSRQLGISKPERFAQHTRFLLGVPPSVLRSQITRDQFIEMVVTRLQRHPRIDAVTAAYGADAWSIDAQAVPGPEPHLPLRDGMGASV